jgi:hypothetical protein
MDSEDPMPHPFAPPPTSAIRNIELRRNAARLGSCRVREA